jgi:sigma-B regulation protein RsbU (phosphoserine phosphatase)
MLEVSDALSTTLDLETSLRRVAELVRKVIDYEIFAILLLNEKTQELHVRFQIGYPPNVAERLRIKVGEGVSGLAAQKREAILVGDVTKETQYIAAVPNVRSELAVPLIVKNRLIGVIDIEAQQPDYFHEEHKRLLTVIASRMAVGIENARLHTRTSRQARTLMLLNEIARELTSILNLDELLKRIAELLSRLIDYQMFSILLLDAAGEKLQHRFSLRFQENIQIKHDIPLGRGVVGYAVQHKQAVLVPDVTKDSRYIPLNARLYEEIARQEKRLERDLALARELQFRLLPHSLPKLANLDVAAKFAPARAIGGDLYDFVNYSLSRLAIVVGDVSGKGAPAAIYAALVSGILRSHAPIEPGPAEMLSAVNFSLGERRIEGQFVSLIYAVWDDINRTLQVASSGLPRPLYCHDGKIEVIEATGLPLGLFDEADYDEFNFKAKPGDMFVFFSDGILDARNKAGDMFSRHKIEEIVAGCANVSADCVVQSLFKAVAEHAEGVETFDDQTVVAIRVKGGSGKTK